MNGWAHRHTRTHSDTCHCIRGFSRGNQTADSLAGLTIADVKREKKVKKPLLFCVSTCSGFPASVLANFPLTGLAGYKCLLGFGEFVGWLLLAGGHEANLYISHYHPTRLPAISSQLATILQK